MNQTLDTQSKALKKREEHLSKDGQWRSFPKVPHLLQYVSNSNYYGRIKVGGKSIRESLKTDVWTTAKLRLTDFLKEHQEARRQLPLPMLKRTPDVEAVAGVLRGKISRALPSTQSPPARLRI
jgi:hypothetical protein